MHTRAMVLVAIWLAQYCASADVLPRLRVASSVDQSGETAALGGAAPIVSADGRRVAFLSRSPNLVTNTTFGEINVYLRLVAESNTVLVSQSLTGAGGNDHSGMPTLSSNGNVIAFQSAADNLVLNDTNDAPDIFLYNATDGSITLVSTNAQGGPAAGASTFPLISADGRYVVFESTAADLLPNDTNNARDIFRADLVTGEMRLVNVAGVPGPDGDCELLTITPNGRCVVFWSSSVAPGTTNRLGQLYVRDLDSAITYSPTSGLQVNGVRQFICAINPDGRYVVFRDLSFGVTGATGYAYWSDLIAGSRLQLGVSEGAGSGLAISTDGMKVIFPARGGLYYRDILESTNRLIIAYQQSPAYPESISSWIADFVVDSDFKRLFYITTLISKGTALNGYDLRLNTHDFFVSNAVPPLSITASGQFLAYEVAPEGAGTNDLNGASDVYLQRFDVISLYNTNYLVSAAHPAMRERTGRGFSTLLPNSLSAAGDRILFVSTDSSFVRNDTNYFYDLFAHDYRTNSSWSAFPFRSNRTWNVHGPLVSATPPFTNIFIASNSAHSISISADGNFAAFARSTGNSIRGPTNVFRADLLSGVVTMIAEGGSPSISQNGHRVAYDAEVFGAASRRDVIVRDFVEPATFTANMRYDDSRTGNGTSWNPQFTPDGQWVVFLSAATDLVQPGVLPAGVRRLFARDLAKARTRLLGLDSNGDPSPQHATNFIISANGRYVIFSLGTALYRHDLLASGRITNSLVCSNCINPSSTADGQWVLYQTSSKPPALFLADLEHATTEQIAADAYEGSISQDGRFIVFTSRASNLVPNDANGVSDVFLRDRWRDTTHLLSATPSGASGNGASSSGFISADGRRVAFQSFASDLAPGDFNDRRDVFYVILDPPNTDGDLLDDDWEEHYFGGLARDGLGDFDGDGYSDWTEQKMGSNPLDPSSNLRIFETDSTAIGTNRTRRITFSWNSAPARLYRAQISTNLNLWMPVPGDIIPGGPTASTTHIAPNPPSSIFYRVSLLE